VLEVLAPEGPVYQAGTLSGNPLATAAGLAVLGEVDVDAYAALSDQVASFGAGLEKVLNEVLSRTAGAGAGDVAIEARVPVVGPLLGLFFVPEGSGPILDYDDAVRSASTGLYARFFRAMLERGVALAPGPYEIAFTSMAHSQEDLERTVEIAAEAMAQVAAA
jgi:glutamate-1-semialdehyde 2,1-aminomutase